MRSDKDSKVSKYICLHIVTLHGATCIIIIRNCYLSELIAFIYISVQHNELLHCSCLSGLSKKIVSMSITYSTFKSWVGREIIIIFCFLYKKKKKSNFQHLLPHISRRLTGELIVYTCLSIPMLQRPGSVRHRSQFQRSAMKLTGQSKPNFMWSILRKGERKFV